MKKEEKDIIIYKEKVNLFDFFFYFGYNYIY